MTSTTAPTNLAPVAMSLQVLYEAGIIITMIFASIGNERGFLPRLMGFGAFLQVLRCALVSGRVTSFLSIGGGRPPQSSTMVLFTRTVQNTPECGSRAGWDEAKRHPASEVHLAVDTLEYLLALHVTAATGHDRDQVTTCGAAVREATNERVWIACVAQVYTSDAPRPTTASRRRTSNCPMSSAARCC